MKKMPNPEKIVEDLEDLGNGPLTLGIFCTKCDAQFDIGREGAAMAILTGASFIEYVKYVQSSKCPSCNKD